MKTHVWKQIAGTAFLAAAVSLSAAWGNIALGAEADTAGGAAAAETTVPDPADADGQQVPAAPQTGWILQEDGWYYYEKDGSAGAGWILDKGSYYYLAEGGKCLTDCLTPDGYYVDANGAWHRRSASLLGVTFQAPERFPAVDSAWTGTGAMTLLKGSVSEAFEQRTLRIREDAIEYVSGTGTKQTVLAGIYKEPERNAYRLDLSMSLNKNSDSVRAAATYDYAVFRAFIYQITSTPEFLEDAVYSSWQEGNTWQIRRGSLVRVGDCQVGYVSDTGCGHYYIYPAKQE